jgi:predicted nucleic acid-binding protein
VPLVVADTGPINYLVLTGHIDILPILFQGITLPISAGNHEFAAGRSYQKPVMLRLMPRHLRIDLAAIVQYYVKVRMATMPTISAT